VSSENPRDIQDVEVLPATDEAAIEFIDVTEKLPTPIERSFRKLKARFIPSTAEAKVEGSKQPSLFRRKGVAPEKKFLAVPIRILMGYLPEVTERDARDYALGVAEKHFEQPALAYFDAFKYGDGWAYEVHEGGSGLAFMPEIIRYFESRGPFKTGENLSVVITTGTRAVEVQRQRNGLSAILLPESSNLEHSAWLSPTEKLSPALNQKTGYLVAGAMFFVTGFFALIIGSMLTRYQGYDSAQDPSTTIISYENLPISQWARLQNLGAGSYVAKLVFEDGRWQVPEIRNFADTAQQGGGDGATGLPAQQGMPAVPVAAMQPGGARQDSTTPIVPPAQPAAPVTP
jgi:hypothetical protein